MDSMNALPAAPKWHENPLVIGALLFCCAPVGIVFAWAHPRWTIKTKVLLSTAACFLTLVMALSPSSAPPETLPPDTTDLTAIEDSLPSRPVGPDPTDAPTTTSTTAAVERASTNVDAPTTTTMPPTTQGDIPATSAQPTTTYTPGVYFSNCTEARAAGVAPIHEGEPGYRPGLDGDGDGTACDS